MLKWLVKYGALICVLNTILQNIERKMPYPLSVLADIGDYIFLFLMFIFSFIILVNPELIRRVIFHKAFGFLVLINFLNLLYFIFMHSIHDKEAIEFMLARGVQFSLFSISIYYNINYYKNTFFLHVSYAIFLMILVGLIVEPNIFSGRYQGITVNPNMLGAFSCLAFSILFLHESKKSNLQLFMLFIFFIISFASGSRAILVGIMLAFLFKYGFSIKNLGFGVFGVLLFLLVVNLQLETSINRYASQGLLGDRILQYEYGLKTFLNKPWLGYGLDKYSYIDKDLVPINLRGPIKGAHNGYLAFLVQYGLIFGGIIISIIFYKSTVLLRKFYRKKGNEVIYLFIISFALISSLFESLITGINAFHTILFWFALSFLSYTNYLNENKYN